MDKHRISLPDGHAFTLHGRIADATGAAWYWLPALGVPGRKYQRLAETLAETGISLFAHEWRGTDTSSQRASRQQDWGYRHLFDDIDAGLAHVRATLPGKPVWIAGHSLGSQLALLQMARDPSLAGTIIVAGGSPYWRTYPLRQLPWLSLGMFGFPVLTRVVGHFPGTRIGFAGRESAGVMSDWAHSARTGRYRPRGFVDDLEARLVTDTRPVLSVHLQHDEYVPPPALDFLLAKAPKARHQRIHLTTRDFPSGKADHFSWMKEPGPVVAGLQALAEAAVAGEAAPSRLKALPQERITAREFS